ncbi:hypothetical protein BDW60DRAFT_101433 [Aspergillus nidulans var. acristatus]
MAFPDLPPLWSDIQLVVFLTTVFLWLGLNIRLSLRGIPGYLLQPLLHCIKQDPVSCWPGIRSSDRHKCSGRFIRLHLLYRLCPKSYPSRSMVHLLTPRTTKLEHNRNNSDSINSRLHIQKLGHCWTSPRALIRCLPQHKESGFVYASGLCERRRSKVL